MIKKIFFGTLIFLIISFLIIKPAFAQKEDRISFPFWGPIMSCNTQRSDDGKFADPCSSLCDLIATGQRAIYFGITMALFILAPIFFLYGSFMFVISRGNSEKLKIAKNILINTALGVVIVLVAFVLVNTFFVFLGPKIDGGEYKWSEIKCNPQELPGTIQWNLRAR